MIDSMDAAPEIRILEDADELAETAAGLIVDLATSAVAQRGRFSVALAGGATPRSSPKNTNVCPHGMTSQSGGRASRS